MQGATSQRTIFLIEDHGVLRAGLRRLLEAQTTHLVRASGSGTEFFSELARGPVDLLVLDLHMGAASGLELLRHICKRYPALPVLAFTRGAEAQMAQRAYRAGAAGFLSGRATEADFFGAVQTILRGELYVDTLTARELAAAWHAEEASLHRLSDREFEVFRLIGSGQAVSGVAKRLGISVKTASAHRSSILRKLGLASNMELIRRALSEGIVAAENPLEPADGLPLDQRATPRKNPD